MANLLIRQCGNCQQMQDEKWVKRDGFNFVCPYCGVVTNFSDEQVQEEQEFKEVFSLLDNMHFNEASSKLNNLRNNYPNSSQVYFLTVLADNRVCYTKDVLDDKRYIPTLNDLPTSSLLNSAYAKKALELAPSELVRESYKQTFDYIESKRLEILEAANNKENQYDVFISTKVKTINNGRETTDKTEKTPDYAYAWDLYNYLREEYPGIRIFFSESNDAKAKMAGNKYENIIYAALHSAKVFILVAESRENIEWRWVRNEWMRYLVIKEKEEPGARNFVLITHALKEVDLPRELQGYQYIDFKSASAAQQLKAFFTRSFNSEQESKKLVAKAFEPVVDTIKVEDIEISLGPSRLIDERPAKEISEDIKVEIECYERALETDSEYRREEAFRHLEELVEREPNAYDAKKLLLLKGTNYRHVNDYLENAEEIIKYPNIALEFISFAAIEDGIKLINLVLNKMVKNEYHFGFSYSDYSDPNQLKAIASKLSYILQSLIIPYVSDLHEDNLKKLTARLRNIIVNHFNYETPSEEEVLSSYLKLCWFLNKNVEGYCSPRKEILSSLGRCYASGSKGAEKIQHQLVDELLKIDPSDYQTIWNNFCLNRIKKIITPEQFIEETEKGTINVSIVGDKETISAFESLFKYGSNGKSELFNLVLLTAVVYDEKSYEKEPDQETLLLSKDVDGSGTIDDYELNGFDLFEKYIRYQLPERVYPTTFNDNFDINSPLLSPNINAYLKKEKPTPLDKLLASFAVKMHQHRFYEHALSIYDLYLAQQDSIKSLDCLLIRYYKELANVRIVNPEELRRIKRPLEHNKLDIDLVQLSKKTPQALVLYNAITNAIDEQDEYTRTYQPIKEISNQLPREGTVDKLPLIIECKDNIYKKLEQVKKAEVRKELEADFAYELDFFKNKLPQIKEAKLEIEAIDSLSFAHTYFKDGNSKEFSAQIVEEKRQKLLKIIEVYDNPALVEKHKEVVNKTADNYKTDQLTKIKNKERNLKKRKLQLKIRSICSKVLHVFLTILQMVAYLSPTVLAIIFAIILFSNLDSANYAFGDSNACIIVWILYTLIALSCSLSFILYRLFKWELNHKSAIKATIASVIISTVASIAGFISLAQIKPDFKFDPASQISIKTTKTSYRTTGGFYYTTISFTITNNCPYAIQSISGYLDVFNGDNLVVSDHYVSFYESFNPDTTVDVDCTMYFSNTDLYKTTYSSMKIDFSYSNIEFGSGYKQSFYRDNLVINIK